MKYFGAVFILFVFFSCSKNIEKVEETGLTEECKEFAREFIRKDVTEFDIERCGMTFHFVKYENSYYFYASMSMCDHARFYYNCEGVNACSKNGTIDNDLCNKIRSESTYVEMLDL